MSDLERLLKLEEERVNLARQEVLSEREKIDELKRQNDLLEKRARQEAEAQKIEEIRTTQLEECARHLEHIGIAQRAQEVALSDIKNRMELLFDRLLPRVLEVFSMLGRGNTNDMNINLTPTSIGGSVQQTAGRDASLRG